MTPRLSARGLERSFRIGGNRIPVLRGIDLDLAPAESVFLCGASGAGKTTLLYTIAGLETPEAGSVEFEGRSLYGLSGNALARLRNERMGFVFQSYFLLPELTALENVLLPSLIGGKKTESRAQELLDRVWLKDRMDHLPAEMSGGEQQRVAIARAFVNRPKLLIADEPTGNLDPGTSVGIMKLLDRINRLGTTVVMSTHDAQIVDQMRRRVVELENGHVVRDQSRGVYGYAR
jgi:putative ABC transport system ATP-binding protein/lipoprotein-releasing system ATP-binding protein